MKLGTITDNHMHIDPINGLGIEAAKRFKRSGGTCLFLVNKMSKDLGVTIRKTSDFNNVFEKTVKLRNRIIKETDLKTFIVIGVHPAEFVNLCGEFGIEKALEISKGATENAGKMIEDGDATALGEMGRPHFEVDKRILDAANELMEHAMCVAKDSGCSIQLHTETATEKLFKEISTMAGKVGLPPRNVVKHFSPPNTDLAERFGIMPSVLASWKNLSTPLNNLRFLLESDYIDDITRPGAVLGPRAVPRITLKLVQDGLLSLEGAEKIHKDNVEKTYNVEIS
jgi:TatD-related deoxyribonuclease